MPGVALVMHEREEIRAGIERGESFAAIGRLLGRAGSTISREVARNNGSRRYRAAGADERALQCRRRPKVPKLIADPQLARRVTSDLRSGYSPAGIAARLRDEGGSRVSHETIYRALYSTTFLGLGLRSHHCLRMRRRRRRHRHTPAPPRRGPLQGIKLIDQRPVAAAERSEPGHWEGDLIIGTLRRSAVVTLVERVSRLTLLADLPDGRTAAQFRTAINRAFDDIPAAMRRTLTWDQGIEMSCWRAVEQDLGMSIYFCHPHSPWERPSNEHTNRQLRYWLPKGTDLSIHGERELDRIATVLNTQPRRLHHWRTAQAIYDRHVAALTM